MNCRTDAEDTASQVAEIRRLYAAAEAIQEELSGQYAVTFKTISKIIRGERRANAPGPVDSSDHRVRDVQTGRFVGRRPAGRLLDGRTWEEFPG